PGKLYLPVIQSLVHNHQAVNVEAQLAQPASLLHWVHGMLAVRRRHPVFGKGGFVPLRTDNDAVLAFLRTSPEETVLCLANLAATPRAAVVQVPEHDGAQLHDVFGGASFGQVGADGTVLVTLGSRDFFWMTVGVTRAATDDAHRPGTTAGVR